MSPEYVIKRPIAMTEKALRQRGESQVVFEVAMDANKIQIADAVERMFEVKVAGVNTLVQRGKVKRMGAGMAKRRNWKKAIVTLQPGFDIQFFDESAEDDSADAAAAEGKE